MDENSIWTFRGQQTMYMYISYVLNYEQISFDRKKTRDFVMTICYEIWTELTGENLCHKPHDNTYVRHRDKHCGGKSETKKPTPN